MNEKNVNVNALKEIILNNYNTKKTNVKKFIEWYKGQTNSEDYQKKIHAHLNDYNSLYPEIIMEIFGSNKTNYTKTILNSDVAITNVIPNNYKPTSGVASIISNVIENAPGVASIISNVIPNYRPSDVVNLNDLKEFHPEKNRFFIDEQTVIPTVNYGDPEGKFLAGKFVFVNMKKLEIIISSSNKTQYTQGNETIYGFVNFINKDDLSLEILYKTHTDEFRLQQGSYNDSVISHKYINYITYAPSNKCNNGEIDIGSIILKIAAGDNPCELLPSGGKRKSKKRTKKTKRSKRRRNVSF